MRQATGAFRWQRPRGGEIVAEDTIEFSKDLSKKQQQSTFGAHFVEVGVDWRDGRNPRAPHACGLRGRPHPQPDDGAQARSSAR